MMNKVFALENPEGYKRNLYDEHPLMINSGTFWRCDHGNTGFEEGCKWVGCKECAKENPEGYKRSYTGRSEITLEQMPSFPFSWNNPNEAKEGDILRVISPIDSSKSALFKLTYRSIQPYQIRVTWNDEGTIFRLAESDCYEILNDSAISHGDDAFSIVSVLSDDGKEGI